MFGLSGGGLYDIIQTRPRKFDKGLWDKNAALQTRRNARIAKNRCARLAGRAFFLTYCT